MALAMDMAYETHLLLTRQVTVHRADGSREKRELFPKRSRWAYGTRVLQLCDELIIEIGRANAYPTDVPALLEKRIIKVYEACGTAKSIAALMNLMKRRFDVSMDHFGNWEKAYSEFMRKMTAWTDMHMKLYKAE